MKPTTVNRKLASLSALYRWAGETGRTERDPTRYINGIKQQPVAPKALSKQDLTRLLRTARKGNKRDAALLEFLAATGLRASEVASLIVGDVELNQRSVGTSSAAARRRNCISDLMTMKRTAPIWGGSLVTRIGLEPTTKGLRVPCSAS